MHRRKWYAGSSLLIGLLLCIGCSQDHSTTMQGDTLDEWGAAVPDQEVIRSITDTTSANLSLKLKPGDRFPLRKIVEQELTQDSVNGAENRISTRLELLFAITVLDKVEDRTKLQVRYEQVKYLQRIGDELVRFDSTRKAESLSSSLQAYHDMVGDGFTFWLGPENHIVAVEGFTEFLNRCLRNVPEEERHQVVLGIEAGSGEAGIANFIDNSIGLLPSHGNYLPGDSWERPSHIGRPIPLHVNNTYTIKHLDSDVATIDIRGKITPSTTMTSSTEERGIRVTVRGGETRGSCTIFRETGLPRQSRVEQNIDMTVMMSGALQFNQRKQITTTVEAFPESSSAPTMISFENQSNPPTLDTNRSSPIRQVSGP